MWCGGAIFTLIGAAVGAWAPELKKLRNFECRRPAESYTLLVDFYEIQGLWQFALHSPFKFGDSLKGSRVMELFATTSSTTFTQCAPEATKFG